MNVTLKIVVISRPPLKGLTRKFLITRHHILKRILLGGDEVVPLDIRPARVPNTYLAYGLGIALAPWRFRHLKPDVVLADDLESGLAAVLVKFLFRVPLVFNFLDDYALIASYEGRGLRSRVLKFLEKAVPRLADGVIVVDTPKERFFLAAGLPPRKLKFVANGADLDLFRPAGGDRRLRSKLGLGRTRTVLFVGKMNKYYELGTIVRAIPAVVDRIPQTKFLFVGDGDDRTSLQELAGRLGVEGSTVFAGFQPAEDIPRIINLAEVCVFPLPDSSALAIFEYMACAKPVVLPDGGTAKMAIPRDMIPEDCAVQVANTPEGFARGILGLLQNTKRAEQIGARARELVVRRYDWNTLARQFRAALTDFLPRSDA
jgi:glycosyltransferase involved in cell wall biosynthesis